MMRLVVIGLVVLWVSGAQQTELNSTTMSPWSGLLSAQEIRELLCYSGRSRTESAFPFQEDCRACQRNGTHANPNVFLVTMIPQVSICKPWSSFPAMSTGKYFCAHYTCLVEECGIRFVPAKYRTEDVVCQQRPHFPCEMAEAVTADPCVRPERWIRQQSSEILANNPLNWWQNFWANVMLDEHF